MAEGLQQTLHQKYRRILQAAGAEWERRFAGREPSDACVSVRISGWNHALSGMAPNPSGRSPFRSQTA